MECWGHSDGVSPSTLQRFLTVWTVDESSRACRLGEGHSWLSLWSCLALHMELVSKAREAFLSLLDSPCPSPGSQGVCLSCGRGYEAVQGLVGCGCSWAAQCFEFPSVPAASCLYACMCGGWPVCGRRFAAPWSSAGSYPLLIS